MALAPAEARRGWRRQRWVRDCTDVDGVYTTDPRPVPEARKLDFISYDEMLVSSAGAAVMHSRSIEFAKKYDVPLMVRSSLSDAEGTWIVPEAEWMRQQPVCGVALVRDEARLLLDGVPDIPGVSHRVFATLAEKNIVVDMIAQGVGSGGRAAIGFTVPQSELAAAHRVLDPLVADWGARLQAAQEVSKVSIVGADAHPYRGRGTNVCRPGPRKHQYADDYDRRHQDFDPGRQEGRDASRPGRSPGVRPAPGPDRSRVKSPSPGRGRHAPASRREGNGKDLYLRRLSSMEDILVKDVRVETGYGQITIFDLPDQPGNCSRVFQTVAAGGINVDMIVQNLGNNGRAEPRSACATTSRALTRTQDVVSQIDATARDRRQRHRGPVRVRRRHGTHTGVARKMFGALAERHQHPNDQHERSVHQRVVERSRGDEALGDENV